MNVLEFFVLNEMLNAESRTTTIDQDEEHEYQHDLDGDYVTMFFGSTDKGVKFWKEFMEPYDSEIEEGDEYYQESVEGALSEEFNIQCEFTWFGDEHYISIKVDSSFENFVSTVLFLHHFRKKIRTKLVLEEKGVSDNVRQQDYESHRD